MNKAVKTVVQLQSDKLRDEAQDENEDFINKLDENVKKIIKEQVKEQVKAQVSKILPKIKKTVNEQLKTKVLTRSSNKSKTSHTVAANLSKLKLKNILIDKMERNKSIHKSDEHKNLYKSLDEDEEPSAGSNRGSKRRMAGKEPESTRAPKEKTSKSTGKSKEGSKSHQEHTGKSTQAEEPIHNKTLPAQHGPVQPWISNLARKDNSRDSFNELMDSPLDFLAFMMNQLKVDTLTPKLLAGPTFKLMKGSCKSLVELEYFFEEVYKATTDQLDWNNPKDDDKLYKLKECDFKRLHIQDIEDMLLLLVQGNSDEVSAILSGDKVIEIKQEL
nr:hypothetical protein [Tanacetum cinerariifolium]